MKNLIYLFMVAALISCKKSDSPNPQSPGEPACPVQRAEAPKQVTAGSSGQLIYHLKNLNYFYIGEVKHTIIKDVRDTAGMRYAFSLIDDVNVDYSYYPQEYPILTILNKPLIYSVKFSYQDTINSAVIEKTYQFVCD